jgi:hypothetical protein
MFLLQEMIETSDDDNEAKTASAPAPESEVQNHGTNVGQANRRRKSKVSSGIDQTLSPEAKPKSKHLDSNSQNNTATKPGPSTLKLSDGPKTYDGDVSLFYAGIWIVY